jgi:hypothetical protein
MNAMFYRHSYPCSPQSTPGESEENAPNVQNARECLRKMTTKGTLTQLRMVAHLHSQIEVERRSQIIVMDKILLIFKKNRIAEFEPNIMDGHDANEDSTVGYAS